ADRNVRDPVARTPPSPHYPMGHAPDSILRGEKMPAKQLQNIKTFPELVAYLRDELNWPIESDDFEDLTYDYEAEELGLDPKHAAKVKYIKQLRPLDNHQPFGIFFVHFEPKKLPVTVIRRILRGLVVKKRASAKSADRAAWE